jgi:mRNA capping enzyme, catalytic domain
LFLVWCAAQYCEYCNPNTPWLLQERTKMLQEYVIAPRDKERAQPGQRHLYDKEDFGLRHKTFWGLDMTQSLLTKFIQKLTHESDGLIFQPVCHIPYLRVVHLAGSTVKDAFATLCGTQAQAGLIVAAPRCAG